MKQSSCSNANSYTYTILHFAGYERLMIPSGAPMGSSFGEETGLPPGDRHGDRWAEGVRCLHVVPFPWDASRIIKASNCICRLFWFSRWLTWKFSSCTFPKGSFGMVLHFTQLGAEIKSTVHDKTGGFHSFHIFKIRHLEQFWTRSMITKLCFDKCTKQSGLPAGRNLWFCVSGFTLPPCYQGSVKKLLTTLKDLQGSKFLTWKFMEFECACHVHENGWRTLLCWQIKTSRNPSKLSFPPKKIVMYQKQVYKVDSLHAANHMPQFLFFLGRMDVPWRNSRWGWAPSHVRLQVFWCPTERLTALQRLTPAAATGHRGALAAQVGLATKTRNWPIWPIWHLLWLDCTVDPLPPTL